MSIRSQEGCGDRQPGEPHAAEAKLWKDLEAAFAEEEKVFAEIQEALRSGADRLKAEEEIREQLAPKLEAAMKRTREALAAVNQTTTSDRTDAME